MVNYYSAILALLTELTETNLDLSRTVNNQKTFRNFTSLRPLALCQGRLKLANSPKLGGGWRKAGNTD